MVSKKEFYAALCERHGREIQRKISSASVGIAGLGGLGSNIAVHLARLGIGRLVICDFDKVDIRNINRQSYNLKDIGVYKTTALKKQLLKIHPWIDCKTCNVRITPENVTLIFGDCDIICEAFDKPDQKAMLIESVVYDLPNIPLICGSGMAGYGSSNAIKTERRFKNVYICGDGKTGIENGAELMSPRVGICAAHQANMALRLILGITTS